MPISQFLTHLLKNKRYSPHTVKSYENDLLQVELYLQTIYQVEVEAADSKMLRSWVVSLLEEGIQPKSVNRKISTLKSFYNFLLKEERIDQSPTNKLISPKVERPLPAFVKQSEMDELFNSFEFEDSFSGRRDELLMELLYSCGIRLSELIAIEEKHINQYDSTMKVLGKRNKERIVPLHQLVMEKIRPFLEEKKEKFDISYLLMTDSGKKMYPKFVYRKVNHYLGQVTTSSKKSPHVLRHTFATHMLNNGADLNTIKEILGHANLSATEVYTHNTIEKLKNIYNQAHPRA